MPEVKQKMEKINDKKTESIIDFLKCLIDLYCKSNIIEDMTTEEFAKELLSITNILCKLNNGTKIHELTDEEIVDLYFDIDCQLFDVIRNDRDIDNVMWAKNIIDVYVTISEYIKENDIRKIWT